MSRKKRTEWKSGPAGPRPASEADYGLECGDRILVLVPCKNSYGRKYWDAYVITPTETGFDDANGEPWGAWDWSDVAWWVKLDKSNMPAIDW